MPFDCPNCGTIKEALLDGYPLGEQVLEGVVFLVVRNGALNYDVRVHPDHAEYFEQLNQDKWFDEVRNYLEHMEKRDEIDLLLCPKCKENIQVKEG